MTVPKAPTSTPVWGYSSAPDWIDDLPIIGEIPFQLASAVVGLGVGLADALDPSGVETRASRLEELKGAGWLGDTAQAEQGKNKAAAQQAALEKGVTETLRSIGEAVDRLAKGPVYLGETMRIHSERGTANRLFIQLRNADKWETYLTLDENGDMKLKGTLTQNGTFDTDGEEPQ